MFTNDDNDAPQKKVKVKVIGAEGRLVPARATFVGSGTVEAATASAQAVFDLLVPEKVDLTEQTKEFLRSSDKVDEAVVRMAMASDETTFEDIGLHRGILSENQARIALESCFEVRARRRGFWQGALVAAVPSLLLGAAALINLILSAGS